MGIESLIGKTVNRIVGGQRDDERVEFYCSDGSSYVMFHSQDCCESVFLEDVAGDLSDLLDSPILIAREDSQEDEKASESGTWTFYNIATNKGSVTIRWYGSSNGYYSESVDFKEVKP